MKLQHLLTFAAILVCANWARGQNPQLNPLIFPFLPAEYQSKVTVTADWDHPKPCTARYTNLLSNTNLFSPAEINILVSLAEKYKNVTTNQGPTGSVFCGIALRQRVTPQLIGTSTWVEATNTFSTANFIYTNSGATEELAIFPGGETDARFRTRAGDGYDVLLFKGVIIKYQEYKQGVLDGLFTEIHDPNHLGEQEHCASWARFTNGQIYGKYLMWQDDQIILMAEFPKPFDFLKHQTEKQDLSWSEISTNR